jgi:hypothetical protein
MNYLIALTLGAVLHGALAVSLIGAAAGISRTATVRNCLIYGGDPTACQATTYHRIGAE